MHFLKAQLKICHLEVRINECAIKLQKSIPWPTDYMHDVTALTTALKGFDMAMER